jgi:hypothetical protein
MKILKLLLFGTLLGAALFYMPFFLLRIAVTFLIIGGLFRLFRGRWRKGSPGYGPGNFRLSHRLAFADKVRAMSDEEYTQFRQKVSRPGECGENANRTNSF